MMEHAHKVDRQVQGNQVALEEEEAAGLLSDPALHARSGEATQAETGSAGILGADVPMPSFFTAYKGQFYLGLPNAHGGIDVGVGSGRAVMNWYKDLAAAVKVVRPRWEELAGSVKYLQHQSTRTWADIDRSADTSAEQITKLNAKSHHELRDLLGQYLAAEKEVSAERANMVAATKLAAAAAHDFNAAIASKEGEEAEQEAGKKAAELRSMQDDRAMMVKGVTALLGIATGIGDVAIAPLAAGAGGAWTLAKLGTNTLVKIVENVEGPEYAGAVQRLGEELAVLRQKVVDSRLTAANEAANAAALRFQGHQAAVVAARNRLNAAKGRAGAAVTALHVLESKHGGPGIFQRIDETSADTADQVGNELTSVPKKGARPGEEVGKTPAERFGEGTLRALALELLATFDSGPFARHAELKRRLDDDQQAAEARVGRGPSRAAHRRWHEVWGDLARYVNWDFHAERERMLDTIAEILREVNQGEHLTGRQATLAKIATQLGVTTE